MPVQETPQGIGSSPRMWGTLLFSPVKEGVNRFIPTHVGNSLRREYEELRRPVHPHACGELFRFRDFTKDPDGSSPRMWGTPEYSDEIGCGERFIPTHVGNSHDRSGTQ